MNGSRRDLLVRQLVGRTQRVGLRDPDPSGRLRILRAGSPNSCETSPCGKFQKQQGTRVISSACGKNGLSQMATEAAWCALGPSWRPLG
eukprot:8353250-Pyramimonas_sp.AAC.1